MCGLFGLFGPDVITKDGEVFEQLMYISGLRGKHSTGVAAIDLKKDQKLWQTLLKRPYASSTFIKGKDYEEWTKELVNPQVLIGHTRYATKGNVTTKNAHPFWHGDVIFAHNGHIANAEQLSNRKDFEVDSEHVAYALSKTSIDKIVEDAYGAFAFSYWDKRDTTFNIVRNSERSLYYCKSSWKEVWYYASEAEMLKLVLTRNKIHHEEIVELPTNTVMTYDVNSKLLTFRKLEKFNDWDFSGYTSGYSDLYSGYKQNQTRTPVKVIKYPKVETLKASPTGPLGSGLAFLNACGIRIGDKLRCWLLDFKPYNKPSNTGVAEGCIYGRESPYIKLLAHNYEDPKREFKSSEDFIGEVNGARYDDVEKEYIIYIKNVKIYVEGDDYIKSLNGVNGTDLEEKSETDLVKIKNGALVTKEVFDELTKDGCCFCSADLTNPDDVTWLNELENSPPCCFYCYSTLGD